MTNDHDQTNAPQMGAHATTSRSVADVHESMTALFSDAEDLIAAGSHIDEAWLDSAAGMLARACVEADLIVLTSFQNRLRTLAGQMARTTATPNATVGEQPGSDQLAPTSGFGRARAQMEVLAATTDAGAELVAARTMGGRAAFESSSVEADVLRVLSGVDETTNRDLVAAVGKHATAISRATGRLREAGLIVGRYYGRNVDWSLTAAGREAVAGISRHDDDAVEPVTTTDGAGLAQAVRARKRAVRIPLQVVASDEPRWATFLRLNKAVTASEDAFETQELPDALVSNDPAAAYVRVDALKEAVPST